MRDSAGRLGRLVMSAMSGVTLVVGSCAPAPIKGRAAQPPPTSNGADGGSGRQATPDPAAVVVRDAAASDSAAPSSVGGSIDGGAATVMDARPSESGQSTDAGRDAWEATDSVPPVDRPGPGDGAARDAGTSLDSSNDVEPRRDAATAPDGIPDAPSIRAPRPGELAIVEALANPSGQDLGREWIEVESLAAETLTLADLHLADGSTDAPASAGMIAPGGRIVLGQSADLAKNGGVVVAAAYGTHLILNNDDEQVSICVGACATGVVIDRASWGTLGAPYNGHAIVIDPAMKALCPASQPFGTAGDFGTPGLTNPPCSPVDGGADR